MARNLSHLTFDSKTCRTFDGGLTALNNPSLGVDTLDPSGSNNDQHFETEQRNQQDSIASKTKPLKSEVDHLTSPHPTPSTPRIVFSPS